MELGIGGKVGVEASADAGGLVEVGGASSSAGKRRRVVSVA